MSENLLNIVVLFDFFCSLSERKKMKRYKIKLFQKKKYISFEPKINIMVRAWT